MIYILLHNTFFLFQAWAYMMSGQCWGSEVVEERDENHPASDLRATQYEMRV